MKVYNHDIASMIARLRRFKQELHKSVSAGLSEFSTADKTRLLSYLASIQKFKNWVIAQPELDLPESSPREFDLGDAPKYTVIENLDIESIMRLLDVLEIELSNSQSARKPAGLTIHDSARFDTVVLKAHTFVNEFMSGENLDLPESSPTAAMSGAGQIGV